MIRNSKLLLIAIFYSATASVYAMHWDIVHPYDPAAGLIFSGIEIPIGCELRGCCPSCSLTDTIDLQIRIDADVTKEVRIDIKHVDPDHLARLTLQGNIRWDERTLVAGPGESFVRGFDDNPEVPVPVIIVEQQLDASKLAAFVSARNAVLSQPAPAIAALEVTQTRRGAVVNTFRSRKTILVSGINKRGADSIVLRGNGGGDNAVIMTDFGTGAGCVCDALLRGSLAITVGEAISRWDCNSEIIVFAHARAMAYRHNVAWTDATDDIQPVDLASEITPTLHVVLTSPDLSTAASDQLAVAASAFEGNRAGVEFRTVVTDVSNSPDAVAIVSRASCNSLLQLKQSGLYTPGRLNIYFGSTEMTGVTCQNDPNVIFIGISPDLASVAHEIGHAYGLPATDGGHTNCLPGFGNDNVMWAGGLVTRTGFTTGQVFRLVASDKSQLNINHDRQGLTRTCPPLAIDAFCPALALDIAHQ